MSFSLVGPAHTSPPRAPGLEPERSRLPGRSGGQHSRAVFGLLLALNGCFGLEFPPEPSTDEEGTALNEALQTLAGASECTEAGVVWPSGPMSSSSNPVLLGMYSGTSGSLRGLILGSTHLLEYPLSEGEAAAPPEEVETLYLPLLFDSARSLAAHARVTDSGGLYWPQCIESSGLASAEDCAASASLPGPARSCPIGTDLPATGLESGAAGIGDTLLLLAEHTAVLGWEALVSAQLPAAQDTAAGEQDPVLQSIASACELIQLASGAGQFLQESACSQGGFPELGLECTDTSIRYTALDRGAAGVGWFFLRLWHATADRSWLYSARDAGSWLVSLMEDPKTGELPSVGAVPSSAGGTQPLYQTGFWSGNAGVAWFLLETAYQLQEAGELASATRLLEGALSIIRFLQQESVKVSALGGAYWRAHDGSTDSSIQSGFSDGIAGISWVFLQASSSGLDGTQGLEVVAEEGAHFLAHALVAHYFRGRVWWPTRLIEGNFLDEEQALQAASAPLEQWSPGDTETDILRGWTLHPGLATGVSGIGQLFRELSRSAAFGSDGAACFEEVSDEAAHFLFLLGRPDTASSAWQWPESAVRLISGSSFSSPGNAGLATGTSGIVHFLVADREADLEPERRPPGTALGLTSLLGRSPAVLCSTERAQ